MNYCKYFEVGKDGRDILPADGKNFTVEELQKLVGGYIQIVPLPRGRILVCNEEGAINDLPRNDMASLHVVGYIIGDQVFGNCLICDSPLVK